MDEQVALIEHACAVFEVGSNLLLDLNVKTAKQSSLQHACPTRVFCLQNPSNQAAHQEASATLLAFRNSDAPIGVCQHVLQSSSSEQARFQVGNSWLPHLFLCLHYKSSWCKLIPVVQAAVTLRDAAVRQWATMSRDSQRALRGYVLHYVLRYDSLLYTCLSKPLSRSGSLIGSINFAGAADSYYNCSCFCCAMLLSHMCTSESIPVCSQHIHAAGRHTSKHSDLVQKQLTGTVAVLLKRGWVDESPEERHAFFREVESTVAGTSDAAARRTGIEILEVSLLAYHSLLLTACMQTDRHPNLHCVECACHHMPHVRILKQVPS